MEQQQHAGADAPADDRFMAELLEGGQDSQQQQESQPQPEPERPDPAQQERPAAREPERIPLPEYLQEREKRQTAERRLAEYEEAEQKKRAEAEGPNDFDFNDPNKWLKRGVRDDLAPLERRLIRQTYNASLREANREYGQEVVTAADQAFTAALQQVDPARRQAAIDLLREHDDPVGEVVRWNQQRSMLSEVGSDPAAYEQKVAAKLLADPAFMAQVAEAGREPASGAASQTHTQPRGDDGKFQAQKPAPQRAQLPSMRSVGSAGAIQSRPSGNQSGDDLLDEIFAAP